MDVWRFCIGMKHVAVLQLRHKRSVYFVYMFTFLKVFIWQQDGFCSGLKHAAILQQSE